VQAPQQRADVLSGELSRFYRGLDLSQPELTTPAELEAFFADPDQPGGRPLAIYELFADLRPDLLKRSLAWSREIHASETFKTTLPYLNVYATRGWLEGVRYEIGLLQPGTSITDVGYRRDTIVETLAVAFYLSPSWGTVQATTTVRECLEDFQEPAPGAASPFPPDWAVAPEALKAGLDYSTRELTTADLAALTDWYMRVCGEVPESVRLYAKYRPTLLKAERNRWEHIVRTGLPNEMFAYLLLHYEVWRGNPEGTRDALLLARGLGMSQEIAVDAIWYGAGFYGGLGSLAAVAGPIREILEGW
jgi:hypothetical protein